ncbi:hypothetical protein KTQ42_21675 [Noviherbaspirillum sp. L7-7A]|uniref:hypothetical protein n=1 Tax=Noviherbaspirillum sp. L7-7A TaxID=2850560 RepID=UPI001C2C4142|nr:hypothetical protein [Noviherbaspirillum sp. L7-7A]MBV0881891.1 hypothetical protein [Noviherbaspirillum sp. L7-7A]
MRGTPNLAGAVMREVLGQWLDREPAAQADLPRAAPPQPARERERSRMRAPGPARTSLDKRSRQEP